MTDTHFPSDPEIAALLDFIPVPSRRNRHDGWTPDAQRRFILMLEATAVVTTAAKAVGKSAVSAYALRKRPGAESFAEAWDFAMETARIRVWDAVKHHLQHGEIVPRFYRGRVTSTTHRMEHRLLFAALRSMDAQERRLNKLKQ